MNNCELCGSTDITESTVTENIEDWGLGNFTITGVLRTHCSNCEESYIEYLDQEEMLGRLAVEIALHEDLKPEQVRALRQHLGLSGRELARLFQVSEVTVSRWQTGEITNIAKPTLNLLRVLVLSRADFPFKKIIQCLEAPMYHFGEPISVEARAPSVSDSLGTTQISVPTRAPMSVVSGRRADMPSYPSVNLQSDSTGSEYLQKSFGGEKQSNV